jgi:small subunit ribosomal protein S8
MAVTDPIADMLTRIRNAILAKHETVMVPASRMKLSIVRILKEEGFITDYEVIRGKPERVINIHLKYLDGSQPAISGLKRVSRPGLKTYIKQKEIPRIYGGLGVTIISTSQGLKTGQQARRLGIGGEILCYVW